MNKILSILLSLLPFQALSIGIADMVFDEMEHNFGSINELGGSVSHRFVYINKGNSPLIINSVHTSCGCTSPAWSKEPVMPSKSGYIDVNFDPRDRVGTFTKSIIINSNASNQSMTLYISGDVQARTTPVAVTYPYNMDQLRLKVTTIKLGSIKSDDIVEKSIEIYNPSSNDIVISTESVDIPDFLTIETIPSLLRKGDKGIIKTKFDAKKSGMFSFVKVDVPILVNNQKYNLHFRGSVSESFSQQTQQNPPKLEFLNALNDSLYAEFTDMIPEEMRVLKMFFKNTGNSTLVIRSVEIEGENNVFKLLTPEVLPGGEGEIHFFVAATEEPEQYYHINIVANIPQQPKYTLLVKVVLRQ